MEEGTNHADAIISYFFLFSSPLVQKSDELLETERTSAKKT
jgi:hypothetical protein